MRSNSTGRRVCARGLHAECGVAPARISDRPLVMPVAPESAEVVGMQVCRETKVLTR